MVDEIGATGASSAPSEPVGMVLGTEDATPLSFWVGVSPDAYLQLDDAVIVDTEVPGRGPLRVSGIVQDVRARPAGAGPTGPRSRTDPPAAPAVRTPARPRR